MIEFNLDGTLVDAIVRSIGIIGLVCIIILFFIYLSLPTICKYFLSKREMEYKFKLKRQLVKFRQVEKTIKPNEDESNVLINKRTLKVVILMAIFALILYLIYKYNKKKKHLIKKNYQSDNFKF